MRCPLCKCVVILVTLGSQSLAFQTTSTCKTRAAKSLYAFNKGDYYAGSSDFLDRAMIQLQQLEIPKTVQEIARDPSSLLDESEKWSTELDQIVNGPLDTLQSSWLVFVALPLSIKAACVAVPALMLSFAALYILSFPNDNYREGYEPPFERGESTYDPMVARQYYSQYPLLVVQRALQLFRYSNGLLIGFLVDKYLLRREEAMRPLRAQQLLELIQRAGPTAIKVGQALSVRPDLIPSEYANALATLQDRVPAFGAAEARALLRQELGESKLDQLLDLNLEQPVAAASIGQVYKCLLKNSNLQLAVKLQRPNVLAEIALDLFIVREFAPYYQKLTGAATNFQALSEEWGRGFLAELDYLLEAQNTRQFNDEMRKRNLDSVIIAPTVVDEYTTPRILTTEWVDGQRLDVAARQYSDVPQLCSIALNAYLIMLLETGTLHCDPHPGNLLRTSQGKLCILDFGMTLETDPTLQYSLLEFVAHLTAEEYNQVPTDLVKLGFLKEERLETVKASGFLEPLTYMLKQAGQGGGAEKVRERIFDEYRQKYPNVNDDDELRNLMRADMKTQIEAARERESAVSGITLEVEELQKRNRDAFRIPEWFLYTSRAFLTLEGICLQADENYSIVQSCFPYVAKRLLGDNSPRAQAALKELLYGASGNLDAQRLADLAKGFGTYVNTNQNPSRNSHQNASNGLTQSNKNLDTAVTLEFLKDGADILLNKDGNLIQNILVQEGAAAFTGRLKDRLRQVLVDEPKRLRETLPLGKIFLPPPLETKLLDKTFEEERAQDLIEKISVLIVARQGNDSKLSLSTQQLRERLDSVDLEQVALVSKTLRENLPKYLPLILQLSNKFSSTVLDRLSDNLENLDSSSPTDDFVKVAARRVSAVAKQSNSRIQPEADTALIGR